MTQLKSATSRDIGAVRNVALNNIENPDDVTDVVVNLAKGTETEEITATFTTVGDDDLTVTFNLGTESGDWLPAGPTLGTWKVEYVLTFADGSSITVRGKRHDEIKVRAGLD